MSKDRLSQIWSSFAKHSSVDLSGTSVELTQRPSLARHAADRNEDNDVDLGMVQPIRAATTEAGSPDPVTAALTAMHSEMTASAKRPKRGKAAAAAMNAARDAHTSLPQSNVERTLLADLAFTRSKTTRKGQDYIRYAADRQDAWQQSRRKKWFFGLF
ncbi:MAG: hypothetical protein AAF986_05185 [Pseudomonadota bacterium]